MEIATSVTTVETVWGVLERSQELTAGSLVMAENVTMGAVALVRQHPVFFCGNNGMANEVLVKIDGEVERPLELTFEDLAAIAAQHQITDVSQYDPQRTGDAVTLAGLLELVGARPAARHLGLHAAADNFHASIPLEPVRERAFLIYRIEGQALKPEKGGPLRFFIPDHAACHTDQIDECANVKFVDHIELTMDQGYDNRPQDDEAHEALHRGQQSS